MRPQAKKGAPMEVRSETLHQREIPFLTASLILTWFLVTLVLVPRTLEAQEGVYQASELSRQPTIANANQARRAITRSYSSRLQDRGLEGRVEVAFVVNIDGSVDAESVRVLRSPSEGLAAAAVAAVSRIKFKPGQVNGADVRCEVAMPISYVLGN